MRVARLFGWFLILLALLAGGSELWLWASTGKHEMLVPGAIWYELHRDSLNLSQVVVQRYLHPTLWDPVIVAVLRAPLWLVPAVPGLLLAVLCRKRRRRRFGKRGKTLD